MLKTLEEMGELDNTLIVVTSDNGMPFPRAKANCYEYGIHVPMAIRWGHTIKGGRTGDDLVSTLDLAPTFLEAAGINFSVMPLEGRSLMTVFKSNKSGILDKEHGIDLSGRDRVPSVSEADRLQ